MEILYNVLHVGFIVIGIILIFFVMIRKGDSGGLSGAFGGVGGDTAFGVKAQKHLDKVITYISAVFILCAIFLNLPVLRNHNKSGDLEVNTPSGQEKPVEEAPAAPEGSRPGN